MPSLHLRPVSSEGSEVKVSRKVYVRYFSLSLVQHAMDLTVVGIQSQGKGSSSLRSQAKAPSGCKPSVPLCNAICARVKSGLSITAI